MPELPAIIVPSRIRPTREQDLAKWSPVQTASCLPVGTAHGFFNVVSDGNRVELVLAVAMRRADDYASGGES